MTELTIMDKSYFRKGKLKQQGNDIAFWQFQPYEIRLAAIEQIRNEYNSWEYVDEQGFQRVYTIIKYK